MRRFVPLLLICAVLVSGALVTSANAEGGQPVATAAAFDKTKFVVDVGTAAFAIHHFIYLPLKGGKPHGFKALKVYAKAAVAALFAINRLHAAYRIANSGNSKLLKAIVKPVNALLAALGVIKSKITHGDTTAVPAANTELSSLSSAAKGAGVPFSDIATNLK